MRLSVTYLTAFHTETLAAARKLAEEITNLVVNCFFVAPIGHEACESFIANSARFVVSVIPLEVVSEVFLGGKDLRTEGAVEHSIFFVIESFERDVLLPLSCRGISGANAFEMSLKF